MSAHLLTALGGLWGLDRARHTALVATVIKAVSGQPGAPPSGDPDRRRMSVKDGIAVIDMSGALWRLDDMDFQWAGYGITTYQRVARDLDAALASPEVRGICLVVDSPGGQINGCEELAQRVADANAAKPLWVYVDGDCASAAYVVSSGAGRIVANPLAGIGSLGVIVGLVDWSGYLEEMGVKEYEFISAISPHKNPDPSTADGRAQYQQLADDTGEAMIARVAARRGITTDTLLASYGQGAVLVAQQAREAGLIDDVNTLEPTLAALRAATRITSGNRPGVPRATQARASSHGDRTMAMKDDSGGAPPALTDADITAKVTSAVAEDRARTTKLLALADVVIPEALTVAITNGTTAEAFAYEAAMAARASKQQQQAADEAARAAERQRVKDAEDTIASTGLAVPSSKAIDDKPNARAQKQAELRAGAKSVGTLKTPA